MINLKDTDPTHVHASSAKYGNVCDMCARASGMKPLEELAVPAQPTVVEKEKICAYCNRPVNQCNDRFDFYSEGKLIFSNVSMVWAKGVK